MADFTPANLKSTTVEGAFLEITQLLQSAEQTFTPAPGEPQPNRVALSISTDANTASITATLPLEVGVSATTGALTVTAAEYC